MSARQGQTVPLQVVYLNPPPAAAGGRGFGLQDRSRALRPGDPQGDGSIHYRCEARFWRAPSGDGRVAGDCVHGGTGDPFLYLSFAAAGGAGWRRRIKLPLAALAESQPAALERAAARLVVRDAGRARAEVVEAVWEDGGAG